MHYLSFLRDWEVRRGEKGGYEKEDKEEKLCEEKIYGTGRRKKRGMEKCGGRI
jgi:hypothetical protein